MRNKKPLLPTIAALTVFFHTDDEINIQPLSVSWYFNSNFKMVISIFLHA